MATQQEIDELSQALIAADAAAQAGDQGALSDARALAAEIDRLTAGAPQPEARGLADKIGDAASFVGKNVGAGAVAMTQGIPFVGPAIDNAVGYVGEKATGRPAEEIRAEFMKGANEMHPAIRAINEMAGGAAATLAIPPLRAAAAANAAVVPITAAVESVIEGPWRRDDGKGYTLSGARNDAIWGLGSATLGLAGGHAVARGGNALANKVRAAFGKAENPFTGPAGWRAQEAVKDSIRTGSKVNLDAPPVSAARPLAEQIQLEDAAKRVLNSGGDPAAELAGIGKRMISESADDLKRVGKLYQTEVGIPALGAKTRAADVAGAPIVDTPRVMALIEDNAAVKKALKRNAGNLAFQNIGPNNLARLHAVKTDLAKRARALAKKGDARSDGIEQAADELNEALAEAVPNYREVAQKYARQAAASAEKKARGAAIGGKLTSVRTPPGFSLTKWAHNLFSSSLPGVVVRGSIAGLAEGGKAIEKGIDQDAAKVLVRLLAEPDKAKRQAILDYLGKDASGRKLRPLTVFNGPNALAAWQREEQQ